MSEVNDEFNDDLKLFMSQPDGNDHIDWIEGNRAGATDRLPVQSEEQNNIMISETMSGVTIPQAATRAALEQILRFAGNTAVMAVVAAFLVGMAGLCAANAARLWLMEKLSEEKE